MTWQGQISIPWHLVNIYISTIWHLVNIGGMHGEHMAQPQNAMWQRTIGHIGLTKNFKFEGHEIQTCNFLFRVPTT